MKQPLSKQQKAERSAKATVRRYMRALDKYAADEIDFDDLMKCKRSAEKLARNPYVCHDSALHDEVDEITRGIAARDKERYNVRQAKYAERIRALREEELLSRKEFDWLNT